MANSKISALTSATTPLAGTEVLPIVQSSATVKASIANIQAAPVSAGVAYGVQHLDSSKTPTTTTSFTYNTGNISSNVPTLTIYGGTTAKTGSYRILSSDSSVDFAIYSTASLPTMMVFTNQALALGTNSVINFKLETAGNLVPQTAAKGINFTANTPASGMTSQLLNWYEEGTWTPVVKDAAAGNAATAAASGGYYTKIGQVVYYTVRLININTTGMTLTNQIFITGLPFTCKNDVRATAPTTVHAVNITSTAGNLLCETNPGTTYTNLYNGTTTGSSNALVSQIVSGSGQLFISGSYIAA